jgi:hypothetical protein
MVSDPIAKSIQKNASSTPLVPRGMSGISQLWDELRPVAATDLISPKKHSPMPFRFPLGIMKNEAGVCRLHGQCQAVYHLHG